MIINKKKHLINIIFLFMFIILYTPFAYGSFDKIRVLLQTGQEQVLVEAQERLQVYSSKNRQALKAFPSHAPLIIRPTPIGIAIGELNLPYDHILISSNDHSPLRLGQRWYRGELIIHCHNQATLEVINELELEVYLRGIMKQEISPAWPIECLKAQAIASRSYALYELHRNKDNLYDLKSTVESQTYLGLDGEDPLTNEAIALTRGLILTFDGQPFPAFFHACCGGHTEESRDVFGDYPGLCAVACPFCQDSPYAHWEVSFSDILIRNHLLRSEIKTWPIQSIFPLEKTLSGRIKELDFQHTKGKVKVSGKKFRQLIGYDLLPSLLCTITEEEKRERGVQGKIFHFTGQGWGHGVGLCQWGAKKMAEDGINCRDILRTYYPLAVISKIE